MVDDGCWLIRSVDFWLCRQRRITDLHGRRGIFSEFSRECTHYTAAVGSISFGRGVQGWDGGGEGVVEGSIGSDRKLYMTHAQTILAEESPRNSTIVSCASMGWGGRGEEMGRHPINQ